MSALPIDVLHAELIAASAAIGSIAGCAAWYTLRVAACVQSTGRPLGELTVAELIALDATEREAARLEAA